MMQATSAMSTWIGTLARGGVLSGAEAAGLAVAAFVVGEERLDELRSDLPAALVEAIHTALEPEPANRFESARAMQQTLADVLRG